MQHLFRKFSDRVSFIAGSAMAFTVALSVVIVWALTGPVFHFSNTWQLAINTGTTIVTFLMVFLIQNTQNRDGKAMQLKLDELIHASKNARDSFIDLEELSDAELDKLNVEFQRIHEMSEHPLPGLHSIHEKVTVIHKRRQHHSS